MWPDGEWRRNDPSLFQDAARELRGILDTLLTLSRTGLYTAFFEFFGHTGSLDVRIYEGRWNHLKDPVLRLDIDCRRYPLRDGESGKIVDAQGFLERLILLVQ